MNNSITDLVVYSSIVAGIYLFTKSGNGASLVKSATSGYAGIVQAETGQSVTA